jgi:hypothetical protein
MAALSASQRSSLRALRQIVDAQSLLGQAQIALQSAEILRNEGPGTARDLWQRLDKLLLELEGIVDDTEKLYQIGSEDYTRY